MNSIPPAFSHEQHSLRFVQIYKYITAAQKSSAIPALYPLCPIINSIPIEEPTHSARAFVPKRCTIFITFIGLCYSPSFPFGFSYAAAAPLPIPSVGYIFSLPSPRSTPRRHQSIANSANISTTTATDPGPSWFRHEGCHLTVRIGKQCQEVIACALVLPGLNVREAAVGAQDVQGLPPIEAGTSKARHPTEPEGIRRGDERVGRSSQFHLLLLLMLSLLLILPPSTILFFLLLQLVGMDLRRRAQLVHVDGPPQHVAKRHDLRPAAPVRVAAHLVAVLLGRQVVLRRGGRHQLAGAEELAALQEEPPARVAVEAADGRRPERPRRGDQVGRVAHAHVGAVGGVREARGDAVEEAVAVAGHLPDGHGHMVEGPVPFGGRAVPAADAGLGLPLAGEEGVAALEEAVVVDLAGRGPRGVAEGRGAVARVDAGGVGEGRAVVVGRARDGVRGGRAGVC